MLLATSALALMLFSAVLAFAALAFLPLLALLTLLTLVLRLLLAVLWLGLLVLPGRPCLILPLHLSRLAGWSRSTCG